MHYIRGALINLLNKKMANYYLYRIDFGIDTFSQFEAGITFKFQTTTLNSDIGFKKGDLIIGFKAPTLFYILEVEYFKSNELTLKKQLEINSNFEIYFENVEVLKKIDQSQYHTLLNKIINEYLFSNNNLPNDNLNILNTSDLKSDFANWLIKYDGIKHNYFKKSFGSNQEKLLSILTEYENIYIKTFGSKIFDLSNMNEIEFIDELERNLYLDDGEFFEYSKYKSTHMPRAILGKNNYLAFLKEKFANNRFVPQIKFDLSDFKKAIESSGLFYLNILIERFVASICTKPFVICSGLSGSGKTKLAQSFVQWISESELQYKIIPVGADWTNREPLLGYPNGLEPTSYVTPDSGALQLIIEASKEENQRKPYFLILDEMNLSHVERYFADFLSIMESGDSIKLYSGAEREDSNGNIVSQEIVWPKNLFIIGTVNIDETTYMFSPKVLDRANVIEFRITTTEMRVFFENKKELNTNELYLEKDKSNGGSGQSMGESFLNLAVDKKITKVFEDEENVLNNFFAELQVFGSEFGYRTATEIQLLISKLGMAGFVDDKNQPLDDNTKTDIAIMQKLLPKLHGSRKKLVGPLETLAGFCVVRSEGSKQDEQHKSKLNYQQFITDKRDTSKWKIKYPISLEKIERMHKNVIENGFTSYAEA
jgi:hypothetical protein